MSDNEQDEGNDGNGKTDDGKATGSAVTQPENMDPDAGKSEQQVIDEITGQLSLFPDENN